MSKFLNGLAGVAFACLTLCTTPAQAQEAFPAKPIRVIVPFRLGRLTRRSARSHRMCPPALASN